MVYTTISLFNSKIIDNLERTPRTEEQHLKTRTQHKNPHPNGSNNKQCINNNKITALEQTAGFNIFYPLVSAVVKAQNLVCSHGHLPPHITEKQSNRIYIL